MVEGDIRVLYRIAKDDRSISLKDVFEKMEEFRKKEPGSDVFFDGDEFAICARPLPRTEKGPPHEHHHKERRKGKQTHISSA